jgi:hypothetical protein
MVEKSEVMSVVGQCQAELVNQLLSEFIYCYYRHTYYGFVKTA